MFVKYMHIEKFGHDEVEGIELGECFLFSKIDGTNLSIWFEDGEVKCGSRRREITIEDDNQGAAKYVHSQEKFKEFFAKYPQFRLFAEFLIPHSLKTYRDDAWRKVYVFDVCNEQGDYLHYNTYKSMLEEFDIDYIPCLRIIRNGSLDHFQKSLEENTFLIQEGAGIGEGIVVKNYGFYNRFGRQVWAKIITNEFKDKHLRTMGAPQTNQEPIEIKIAEKYVTQHFVDKVYNKIRNERDGWKSQYIPQLLGTVFYDLVREEMWDIVKKNKFPVINFKTLNHATINQVKQLRSDLF